MKLGKAEKKVKEVSIENFYSFGNVKKAQNSDSEDDSDSDSDFCMDDFDKKVAALEKKKEDDKAAKRKAEQDAMKNFYRQQFSSNPK